MFTLGGPQLANRDSFKYLGIIFTKTHNMAAAAEHMLTSFMAGCRRIRQFALKHRLTDRPHSMLWLAKGYALSASMYASQIWGTRYMKQGAEMDCPLQTVHMCLLKGILGVKRTAPNWSVLRECGQEPLQLYWFRAAVRLFNALLSSNKVRLGFKAVSAERGQLSRLWPTVRFEPRTHRLRGWIIDFPSQVPRRLLDYPELSSNNFW